MKRVLCRQIPQPGKSVELSEDEAGHLTKVLRMRNGDRVEAMDGHGLAQLCRLVVRGKTVLIQADADQASATARESNPGEVVPLELEMAVLKGDAMEWVVEKAVELGVQTLIPLSTAHSVVQIGKKGPEAFQERWQKIADQALKQCGRLERLKISLPTSLEERLRQDPGNATPRFWCDEAQNREAASLSQALHALETQSSSTLVRLLIGPEGGWSELERDLLRISAKPVSLGPLILRAETAALFGISLISAHFRGPST